VRPRNSPAFAHLLPQRDGNDKSALSASAQGIWVTLPAAMASDANSASSDGEQCGLLCRLRHFLQRNVVHLARAQQGECVDGDNRSGYSDLGKPTCAGRSLKACAG
jgi:hypothetical protein